MFYNLEQARKQAKELLRSAQAGDPEALARLPRAHDPVRLADAQLAIARESGHASWPEMQRTIDGRQLREARADQRQAPLRDPDLAAAAERLVIAFIDLHESASLPGPDYPDWTHLRAFVPVNRAVDQLEKFLAEGGSNDPLSPAASRAIVAFHALHAPGAAEADDDGELYEALDDAMYDLGRLFGRTHTH